MRRNVFISHSSHDLEYAEGIRLKLEANKVPSERVFVSKFAIRSGDDWENIINDAIQNSRVVVFLISDHFKVSEYIPTEIRRALNQASADSRLQIRWLKISETDPPEELEKYQAYLEQKAIGCVSEGERDKMIDEIAKDMQSLLGPDGSIRDVFEDQVEKLVQRNFGLRLRKRLARGDSSIVFLGEGPGFRRVIKAKILTTSDEAQQKCATHLEVRVAEVSTFKSAPFIWCTNGLVSNGMQVLVSDFVPRCKSLKDHLASTAKPPSVGKVRQALGTLADALAQYHAEGLVYGNLPSGDVLVERPASNNWGVRLHSLRLESLNEELWQSSYNPTTESGWSKLEVLAPEQHQNLKPTEKTDQYALGIIGIEMLQGKPPVQVRSIKDLLKKEDFFADPFGFRGTWQSKSPNLARIITKMLDRDPDKRYATMEDVLCDLNVGDNFEEDNRKIAKQSYQTLHISGMWFPVLADFYGGFLKGNKARRTLFKKAFPGPCDITETAPQIIKLDKAILYLLNFRSDDAEEPTTLTNIRNQHASMGLTARDFLDFETHLLRALMNAGEGSDEAQEAWQITIKSGLEYMESCVIDPVN